MTHILHTNIFDFTEKYCEACGQKAARDQFLFRYSKKDLTLCSDCIKDLKKVKI